MKITQKILNVCLKTEFQNNGLDDTICTAGYTLTAVQTTHLHCRIHLDSGLDDTSLYCRLHLDSGLDDTSAL